MALPGTIKKLFRRLTQARIAAGKVGGRQKNKEGTDRRKATGSDSARKRIDGDSARKRMGMQGESAAARYLEARDYKIVERNYRCPIGELDLVVCDREFLVFVEVKTRKTGGDVHPSLSVGRRKQRKVRQLGEYYLAHHPKWVLQPRFDVIAVTIENGSEKIDHIPNAF